MSSWGEVLYIVVMHTLIYKFRFDVMVVKFGSMRSVTSSWKAISRSPLLLFHFYLFPLYKYLHTALFVVPEIYQVRKCCICCGSRIWKQVTIIALNAKLGLTLSYLIQKLYRPKQSKLWFLICMDVFIVIASSISLLQFNLLKIWLLCRNSKRSSKLALPDKVSVVCSGVEGIYFPSLHL